MSITNVEHLCINCMREKSDGGVCPFCGFDETKYVPSPHHLPPRSILGGKCLIGRVLGEGGFGITYMGWDLNLDLKLAIKEYYPSGFVTRTNTTTNTVTPYHGDKTEFFTKGRSRFINEAKTLAKYYALPGIVSVRDFFLENGTAYIVMEFVEGETLKQRLARVGGKMSAAEVFELVRPLLRSLAEMHASGLIHRDISPDNIMITPENNVKLIDFGAARDYLDSGNRSLSVMLKPGFAPEEQYFARGQQGPWTDIYALSATIYRAITGTTPPESVERLRHDELKAPSALGARISPAQEAALLKGMAVSQEARWQTIPELYAALYPNDAGTVPLNMFTPPQRQGANAQTFGANETAAKPGSLSARWRAFIHSFRSPMRLIPVGIAAVLTLVMAIVFFSPKQAESPDSKVAARPTATLAPSEFTVPPESSDPAQTDVEAVASEAETLPEDDEPIDPGYIFPLKMPERIPASQQKQRFIEAVELLSDGEYLEAMTSYDFSQRIAAATISSVVLDSDGTPIFSYNDDTSIGYWSEIGTGVSVVNGLIAALHEDGKVTMAYDFDDAMKSWNNIVAITSGDNHIIGLKKDGTALAYKDYDAIEGLDEVEKWTDLVAVSAGAYHSVGLKGDGTVVAAGENSWGECNVENWSDIVRIAGGMFYTAGLHSDGTVVTTSPDTYDTSDWRDIIAIDATGYVLAGIDVNGKVHLAGYDSDVAEFKEATTWINIVAVSKGLGFIIGLQSDGTILAFGDSDYKQYDLIVGKQIWGEW